MSLESGSSARSLALATTQGSAIENFQSQEVSQFERSQFAGLDRQYTAHTERRSEPSAVYNCHGLSFASRRTGIFDSSALYTILEEDRYVVIPRERVLPGDLILYFDDTGDIEHSGIVITTPTAEPLGIPRVMSKWGKYCELIHWGNNCPYNFAYAKYYRIRNVEA